MTIYDYAYIGLVFVGLAAFRDPQPNKGPYWIALVAYFLAGVLWPVFAVIWSLSLLNLLGQKFRKIF